VLVKGTGVTTDPETKWLSWIMMATLLPYMVAQLPQLLGLTTGGSLAVATAGVISVVGLIVYCTYQVTFIGFPITKASTSLVFLESASMHCLHVLRHVLGPVRSLLHTCSLQFSSLQLQVILWLCVRLCDHTRCWVV
jgi:hypothetical protein